MKVHTLDEPWLSDADRPRELEEMDRRPPPPGA